MTDLVAPLTLTDEQRAVVERPWDARVLVTAGAGTGKTHTMVCRLNHLVGHPIPEEAVGADELLVLSFSRAAVRELTERLRAHGGAARTVRPKTFDAWALELLSGAYPGTDWSSRSFDDRIREATAAVRKGAVEVSAAGVPAHIVVDEAQDLVGDRRDMVETLIDVHRESLGFTIVGDDAQFVYGFQIEDRVQREREAGLFFDWVRASFDDHEELHLTRGFRATSTDVREVLPFGDELRSLPSGAAGREAAESIYERLRLLLSEQGGFPAVDDELFLASLRATRDRVAILTRDNRQALKVSEILHEHRVEHALRRSAHDRSVPSWVVDLLGATEATTLSENRFRSVVASVSLPEGTEPAEVWRVLRSVASARGSQGLDLGRIAPLVRQGRFPEDLADPVRAHVVVSTVHRAKGLEFDRVIVLTPPTVTELRAAHPDVDMPAEARALYVAMTRPREDLYHVTAPQVRMLRRAERGDRVHLTGRKAYQRFGVELRGGDVDHTAPFGDALAPAVQTYLREKVRPGDAVELRRINPLPAADGQSPRYEIVHEGRAIGEVSEKFRKDWYRVMKINRIWNPNWPKSVVGCRIDSVVSAAGPSATSQAAGLGGRGVWLAPRVGGLGRHVWACAEKETE
ncbi:UvrD-helicase domain-containing protein [Streptomyces beihaiensis]|uniref:DNA 3'-5' helicase n=1 Tax=Streptomyces beihaiensis TaxID=2984495 RepID=A0ABT3U2U5_9ACTN|nr:UvrD-helicase domain-containing protein [Streptomyces beihaiensis]MCX3063635.1 UvrD-helicase domain-containing protein [Streptomyces beihaiensis]